MFNINCYLLNCVTYFLYVFQINYFTDLYVFIKHLNIYNIVVENNRKRSTKNYSRYFEYQNI